MSKWFANHIFQLSHCQLTLDRKIILVHNGQASACFDEDLRFAGKKNQILWRKIPILGAFDSFVLPLCHGCAGLQVQHADSPNATEPVLTEYSREKNSPAFAV